MIGIFTVFTLPLWVSSNIIQNLRVERDYNRVNFIEYSSFEEFQNVHLTGERTNRNLLLGVYDESCKSHMELAAFRGAQRHAGNVLQVVSLPRKDFPLEIDGCSELLIYRYDSELQNPFVRSNNLNHSHVNDWVAESLRTDIKVKNGFDFPINFYWHDESHQGKKQKLLAPGQMTSITSFLGHIFSAHRDHGRADDSEPKGEMVDFMVVDGSFYEFKPANRLETCEIVPGSANSKFVDPGSISCDDMSMRFVEFSHNIWYEKRLALNFIQPAFVRPVTNAGFELRRLPEETFKWLREWYAEHQAKDGIVEGPVGPCMNQHLSESVMTHLTPEKKDQLSLELRDVLEDWYGGRLELTSIYGIRKYQNGAVLRMHVDTVNTHVVSAIINVDQGVDEEWPLVILDHNDKEHTVLMKAGDMLLYESARLLHGRPTPFKGTHYDNVFIHYKPTEGWDYDWM